MAHPRRSPSRQARSALLWCLVCFVLSELGLELAAACRLPEMRDPEYGVRMEGLKERIGRTAGQPFTVIMLGSSRTTLGLAGSRLESLLAEELGRPVLVYNFGLTGAGPILEELALRRLLHGNIKPDLVLIEVLPPLLAGQWPHELDRLPITRLWLGELPLLQRYGAILPSLRAGWWLSRPAPAYAYRFSILSRLLPAFVPYQLRMDWLYQMNASGDVAGLKKRSPQWHASAVQRTLADYERYFVNFRIEGPESKALENLLAFCRKKQVHAALLLMPEEKRFRGLYPAKAWREIDTLTMDLSQEFGVPLINARQWMRDTDFSDAHHLFEEAAARFTERLGREALLPLLWVGGECDNTHHAGQRRK